MLNRFNDERSQIAYQIHRKHNRSYLKFLWCVLSETFLACQTCDAIITPLGQPTGWWFVNDESSPPLSYKQYSHPYEDQMKYSQFILVRCFISRYWVREPLVTFGFHGNLDGPLKYSCSDWSDGPFNIELWSVDCSEIEVQLWPPSSIFHIFTQHHVPRFRALLIFFFSFNRINLWGAFASPIPRFLMKVKIIDRIKR